MLNSIIDNNFYIDSARFIIQSKYFDKISLPEQYLIQTYDNIENSEIIKEFKQKGLNIPYLNTTIYLNRVVSKLNEKYYDNIVLLFSSKCSIHYKKRTNKYFSGITLETYKTVLNFIRYQGLIDFNNFDLIIKNTVIRDIDIKQDYVFDGPNDQIRKQLKRYFENYKKDYQINAANDQLNNIASGCKIYDSKNNFGLQINHRTGPEISFKWYCKSLEIKKPENTWLTVFLNEEIKKEIKDKTILRFEFNLLNDRKIEKCFKDNKLTTVLEACKDFKKMTLFKNKLLDDTFNRNINTDNLMKLKEFKPLDQIIINLIYLYKTNFSHDPKGFYSHDNLIISACLCDLKGTEKSRQKKRIESFINFVNYHWQSQFKEKDLEFKKDLAKKEFLNIELIKIFH